MDTPANEEVRGEWLYHGDSGERLPARLSEFERCFAQASCEPGRPLRSVALALATAVIARLADTSGDTCH